MDVFRTGHGGACFVIPDFTPLILRFGQLNNFQTPIFHDNTFIKNRFDLHSHCS
jgi:hypothetical protein